MKYFINDEPTCCALLNKDNARPLMEDLVNASMDPHGSLWLVRDPQLHMKLIGARAASFYDKDVPKKERRLSVLEEYYTLTAAVLSPDISWQIRVIYEYLEVIDAIGTPRIPEHIRKYVKASERSSYGQAILPLLRSI